MMCCKSFHSALVVFAVAGAAFAVGRFAMPTLDAAAATSVAQPGDKKQPAKPAEPPQMPPGMTVGPEHKALDVMLGTWVGSVKFKMGDEWVESKGTATREWAMDGRFIIEHVNAEAMGTPFKGMGIVGYNGFEKKYESAWIESVATNIATATGTYDAKSKVFTFIGDMFDPMTGKRVKTRSVFDCSDPNREVMKGYAIGADGKEEENFNGVFEKKR